MAHTRYTFHEQRDAMPLEQLLYISSTTYEKDWISLNHSHSFVELFYVVGGKGYLSLDGQDIPIKKDQLIIVNPNVRHTEKSSSKYPLSYIVLGIDNLHLESQSSGMSLHQDSNCSIYDFASYHTSFFPIFSHMLQEVKKHDVSYESICQHYLSILMLTFERITGDAFTAFSPEEVPSECEQIKLHIDSHYQDTLSLDTLAEFVHLNKYYLAHLFSEAYGISPIHYLLERRLLHSKELLKTSSYSITQIAQVTGFSSANYFSQAFKKHTGMTPRQYRDSHR